jgi:hypothetical protein
MIKLTAILLCVRTHFCFDIDFHFIRFDDI